MLYLSGLQEMGSVPPVIQEMNNPDDLFLQTGSVYRNHDAVLKVAGCGWDGLINIHQYISQQDRVKVDQIRRARAPYLPFGNYLSTSLVAELDHSHALICVELNLTFARKEPIQAPGVWGSPGGPHALRIGNTVYVQATVSRALDGKTMFPGDIVGQANLSYRNLDGTLNAANIDWNDVVRVRTYCKRPEDIGSIGVVRDRWLPTGRYTSTAVVTKFLDPELLIEVEVTAVTG